MPRIRSLKHTFFSDERMARYPRDVRLTFIGLITHADDDGRLKGDPRLVKAEVWPLDDDIDAAVVSQHLSQLASGPDPRIDWYEVGGLRYIQVRNFRRHQYIQKPRASELPPPERSASPPEPSGSGTIPLRDGYGLDVDRERDRDRDVDVEARGRARSNGRDGKGCPPEPLSELTLRIPEAHRAALRLAVAECDRPASLAAELRAALDGMHGPALAPEVVGQAVHDLVANGDHRKFNARLVRRYLAGVDPPANPGSNGHGAFGSTAVRPDAERAFDDALQLIRSTPGGWRQITADTLAALPPPMRAGIRAADGVRALADADEFTLRVKRKLFTAAYLASPQEQPA